MTRVEFALSPVSPGTPSAARETRPKRNVRGMGTRLVTRVLARGHVRPLRTVGSPASAISIARSGWPESQLCTPGRRSSMAWLERGSDVFRPTARRTLSVSRENRACLACSSSANHWNAQVTQSGIVAGGSVSVVAESRTRRASSTDKGAPLCAASCRRVSSWASAVLSARCSERRATLRSNWSVVLASVARYAASDFVTDTAVAS